MYDVSKNRQKRRIRQIALSKYSFLDKSNILEVFAGWGNMTKFWVQVGKVVYCNDKDISKLDVNSNKIVRLEKDYKNEDIITLSRNIQIVDCDAHGLIIDYVKQLCEVSDVDKLIYFTDGIKKRANALKRINVDKYFHNYDYDEIYYEPCMMGHVYYGYVYKKGKK